MADAPCFNHSLSGCQGEMPNKPFTVKVTDGKGAVIVRKRDAKLSKRIYRCLATAQYEGTLEVSYNGKRRHAICHQDDSRTCLTELPLR